MANILTYSAVARRAKAPSWRRRSLHSAYTRCGPHRHQPWRSLPA